ncbi:hypothetical protein [Companilactobacillus nuruki]|uniref:Uncharacterized protein n=1 Tax=Companilactobacillus nuruki TaxID=1993540 RepID=A0A2N7ASE8_9LACO|nr:hypothetical protein [Companilactobacillus nuruki]PMD68276.1 hypothetical protein CBP76_10065 [Companilactobacillus nuruki]
MLSIVDKASELLKDDSITISEIEKATGISQIQLTKLRESNDIEEKIEDLKYKDVLALADMFNNIQIECLNMHDNDFYKFVVRMGDWFGEAIEIQEDYYDSPDAMADDMKIAAAIQELNNISTQEKSIMLDLYFSYSRDGQSMS